MSNHLRFVMPGIVLVLAAAVYGCDHRRGGSRDSHGRRVEDHRRAAEYDDGDSHRDRRYREDSYREGSHR